jgi:ligand-binding sensor domain-containing protein
MKYLIILLIAVICNSVCGQPSNDRGPVYITVDRGVNWARADIGLPTDAAINAWATRDGVVIAGTEKHGVFISSDRMTSWYAASTGLPRNARIMSVVFANNLIFVGTHLHGLFYSDNRGNSWQPSSKGLTNSNIRVLYHLDGIIFAGTDKGLYVSNDAGMSWKLLLNGLQINSMTSQRHELFVATNEGVLRTVDLGRNWQWIYSLGAIFTLTSDATDIYMLDFFGKVYKAAKENYVWIKADIFMPFHYTFRIAPNGRQFFTSDWSRALRDINGTKEVFLANGIPEDAFIGRLLDTPFGVLAAVGSDGC